MPRDKPRLMFEIDGRHSLIYMYEPPIQKEEYEAAVDELVGTPVDALMLCLGEGRTMLHDTEVGELWGHNVDKWPHLIFRRAHQNVKKLIAEGNDPLRVICERAHEKGLKVYPQLIVNQGRGDRDVDVRCSNFRFDNPHLEIGAKGGLDGDWRGYTCLDFAHEDVRAERLAVIEEVLTKYGVDGLELQMNFLWPWYFHPDEVEHGRPIMTEWIRQVYEAVKASASGRELAIHVPATVASCKSVGLDVEAWIAAGTVDVLIGNTFAGTGVMSMNNDFRSLVAAARGSACRIYAALPTQVDSDRLMQGRIEHFRACACNFWAQGIDGLYLTHWAGMWPYDSSFYEILRELPHPEVMAPKDKIYQVPTMGSRHPEPATEPGVQPHLPANLNLDEPVEIPIPISDDLRRWDRVKRVHEVLLRVRIAFTTELDRLRFSLNGAELPESSLRKINELYRMAAPRYRTGCCYWFIYRLDGDCRPLRGDNRLEITLLERDPDVTPQIFVRDVELEIRYLMGKNYHRSFVDQDLGPHEHATS